VQLSAGLVQYDANAKISSSLAVERPVTAIQVLMNQRAAWSYHLLRSGAGDPFTIRFMGLTTIARYGAPSEVYTQVSQVTEFDGLVSDSQNPFVCIRNWDNRSIWLTVLEHYDDHQRDGPIVNKSIVPAKEMSELGVMI